MNRRRIRPIVLSALVAIAFSSAPATSALADARNIPTISTAAGGPPSGLVATDVSLQPGGLAFDPAGNLYVTDLGSGVVYRVAPDGTEYVVAGSGSRCIRSSEAVDAAGCDDVGDGGPATGALLSLPNSVAIGPDGDVYVSEWNGYRIRRIDAASGTISTVAGTGSNEWDGDAEDGPATKASLFWPSDLQFDPNGNLVVNDRGDIRLRVMSPDGTITTVAGCGNLRPGCDMPLVDGSSIDNTHFDSAELATAVCPGDRVYVSRGSGIFEIDFPNREYHLIAGNLDAPSSPGEGEGGPASDARFANVASMACAPNGDLYLMDIGTSRIDVIEAPVGPSSLVRHVAGCSCGNPGEANIAFGGDGGDARDAKLGIGFTYCCSPGGGMAVDAAGNLYFSDIHNNRVRRVDASTGVITTVVGNGYSYNPYAAPLFEPGYYHHHVTWDGVRDFRFPAGGFSGDGGPASSAELATPNDVVADAAGNVYVLDKQENRVRRITPDGTITTVAGSGCLTDTMTCYNEGLSGTLGDGGPATSAFLRGPTAIALDHTGTQLYIVDEWHQRIRQVNLGTSPVTTYPVSTAPITIAPGNIQTIFGPGYSKQVPVRPPLYYDGTCNTFYEYCGEGAPATANGSQYLSGIAADASGNLYVSDAGRFSIREIEANTGEVLPFAGQYWLGSQCGNNTPTGVPALATALCGPATLRFGPDGNLYVAEQGSGGMPTAGVKDGSRIVKFDMSTPQHVSSVVAGTGAAGFGGDGGPATSAQLAFPHGMAFGPDGSLYIADTGNARIRRVSPDGTITTVAGIGAMESTWGIQGCGYGGDGGAATSAMLCAPMGIAFGPDGVLYVADEDNSRLRAISGL